MAFSFGNTQPAFGAAPAKPTGFGTAFGTPASSAPTAFGTFGSTTQPTNPLGGFGAIQSTPAFGSTFGAPASSAPAFGSTFGAPANTNVSTFGTGFGTAPTSTGTSLFGATTKPSLFSTPSLFPSSSTTAPSLFGAAASTQAPSLFGGTVTTSTPSLFGSITNVTPSLFGSSFGGATTSTAQTGTGLFGGGLFGTSTTSAPNLLGGFGSTTTNTSGFGGFGATNTSGFGFGPSNTSAPNLFGVQTPAKPPEPQATLAAKNQQVLASVYAINVFNDERDDILKKWNMLQACWGTGKGYYNACHQPIDYDSHNPFFRFKVMGYNIIPEQDNSEGIVKLIFNKKVSELKSQTDVLKNGIGGILGNKPNLTVDIVQIKAISDTCTEVKICVSEKGVTGSSRKIPAMDLATFLNQPVQKQQLTNVGVTSIAPFVTPSKSELEEYLKNPPAGIDLQMWRSAIADNPNPKKYIPVVINGFSDLRSRMLNEEYQTGLHQAFLEKVNKDITDLKTKHSLSMAQITELKQKFQELQHRILRILVKQESSRKVGLAIQPEEELLRGRLELMHNHLNVPDQYKGRINELLSHVKMLEGEQKQYNQNYRIDGDAQEEIKQFLKMEQNGIAQLINIVNSDLQSLKIINEGMEQIMKSTGNNYLQ